MRKVSRRVALSACAVMLAASACSVAVDGAQITEYEPPRPASAPPVLAATPPTPVSTPTPTVEPKPFPTPVLRYAPTATPVPTALPTPPPPTATPALVLPTPAPVPRGHSAEYELGQCYAVLVFDVEPAPQPVSCTGPHLTEVFARTDLNYDADAVYPGEDLLIEQSKALCKEAFGQTTGVPSDASVVRWLALRPSVANWEEGDREVVCLSRFVDPIAQPLATIDPLRAFGHVSTYGMELGDCLVSRSFDNVTLDAVDCSEPHFLQVYFVAPLERGERTGPEFQDEANAACGAAFEPALGQSFAESVWTVEAFFSRPQWPELPWNLVCLVTSLEMVSGTALRN